jgi:hypothetical protein
MTATDPDARKLRRRRVWLTVSHVSEWRQKKSGG